MYQNVSINLLNLILSLSDALDLASPELSQHQLRTAFIVWEISKAAGLPSTDIEQLFIVSLLHDVGALSLENKITLHQGEETDPEIHSILGERMLRHLPIFGLSSKIIRFHHTEWQALEGRTKEPLIFSSQILFLADVLERSVDRQTYILHQDRELVARISALSRTGIDPEVVQVFKSVAVREDFWLDLVSPRLYSLLLHDGPSRGVEIDLVFLKPISELFRNIIDFRSRFTSTHSSGVATSASEISRFLGLTETEIGLMEVAGNLHDLGKMVIPNSILDKPDKLNKAETAIMRQHTYFTYTVLNTIGGILQIAEWAAFHHERLDGSGYPFHLGADKLSIGARIMSVADIFTALAEDRPYREGLEQREVISILRGLCAKNFIDRIVLRVLEENYEEILTLTKKKQAEAKEYYEQEFVYP
ncbi:MAG: HD domain-containing protein [Anaerolineales bacterium]|nr:HD domain-containing protein [Anaerolineales bacterium]